VAGLVLGAILAATRSFPSLKGLHTGRWVLLSIALFGLLGNYVFYLLSLKHTTPAVAQVVIQLGPMFFLLGGLAVFKENFSIRQWIGFALLLVGLILFFNRRLPQLMDLRHGTGLGVVLILIAALLWAAYALAQKQLLKHFKPQQILLLIYIGAMFALLPAAQPGTVGELTTSQFWLLVFACANTLVAYGAFAEALEHWEVSRVSAVLAITPIFTLVSVWLINRLAPGLLPPEGLNVLSVVGALLVVGGSAICVLGAPKTVVEPAPCPPAS
jgi:drug/metabolite transporter (DMT)-like permease